MQFRSNENEHIKTFEHELVTSDQGRQVEKYFHARDKTKLIENIKEIQSIAGKANTIPKSPVETKSILLLLYYVCFVGSLSGT